MGANTPNWMSDQPPAGYTMPGGGSFGVNDPATQGGYPPWPGQAGQPGGQQPGGGYGRGGGLGGSLANMWSLGQLLNPNARTCSSDSSP